MSTVNHTRGDKHAAGTRVRYSNGVEAVVNAKGQHRIVSSSAAAAANARQTKRYSKALGPRGAARAFNQYYRNKNYASGNVGKRRAMTRDLCHEKKPAYRRSTSAYKATRNGRLTGPGNYDYPGVDDGSRCPQRGGDELEQFGAGCRFDSVRGRCLKAPSDRMDGRCEVGSRYMRKGKEISGRCKKVAVKKSPKKKAAKKGIRV